MFRAALSTYGREWFSQLAICDLFKTGYAPEFEEEISRTLWQVWTKWTGPGDMQTILQCASALGASSREENLDMLRVIKIKCIENLRELQLDLERRPELPTDTLSEFEKFELEQDGSILFFGS